MAKKKILSRKLKQTLVFIGEGETEKAFLQHIKALNFGGSLKITVKSAGGKGPSNVIGDGIGTKDNSGCDYVAVLLDTDITWPKTKVKQAQAKKIKLIGATPCIEGLMLDILDQKHPTPSDNDSCKAKMHPQLSGKPTDKSSYESLFTKQVLTQAASKVTELDEIIKTMTGKFK